MASNDPAPLPAMLRFRRPLVVGAHAAVFTVAYFVAFLLRYDFRLPGYLYDWRYLAWLVPLLLFRALAFQWYGLFHGMWRYTGQRDLEDLLKATLVSSGAFSFVVLAVGVPKVFPRSVFLAEFMIALGLAAGLRLGVRAFASSARRVESGARATRVLVVGAGDAGEALVREMLRRMPGHVAVGFLDDNPAKAGMTVHGVPVLGTIAEGPAVVRRFEVDEVVVAIPSASGREMRRIVEVVGSEHVKVRTLPDLQHLINGRVSVQQIREVAIEDLLGRAPVQLDTDRISRTIRDQVVLVTGAGGSIGSELCRQLARFGPRRVVLLEQAENALYHVHQELLRSAPDVEFVPAIADVTDRARLDELFSEHRPSLVLHAAAHKHVPMMEWNPREAAKNNVGGTREVVDAAHRWAVSRFVMISTDKAVNPTSVMGCTKRVAELYVQARAAQSSTAFLTVRFGNVLGSNGSVIPLFKEQIARGGPVTVTHPDMVRYFMTIPEASQLVLEAGTMGTSGEIYVLDMGSPVRIVQLAEDLIRLSGLVPHQDVEVAYTGVRPGEKLFEEILTDSEHATVTRHPKIFVGKGGPRALAEVSAGIDRLLAPEADVRAVLAELVPEYQGPSNVVPLRRQA